MATFSERLAYVLSFDTTSGVKSLEKFGNTADKELSKADKGFLKSQASMNKFGAGLVAVAGVAGVGLAKLAMGALETQQNMAALEQIVGKTMTNDMGEWAADAANSLGLSKAAAIDNVTAFAQLAKMAGVNTDEMEGFSEGLVGLGADFAAFKNVSPEKAIQDIRSAFSGSVEVLRKYGIFLDDATLKQAYFEVSGEQVTGTLTGQQKVLAVNRELYRQGADMIGQFGRESGELSGQIPILKANLRNMGDQIGSGVLPALTGVVGLLAATSSAASNLSPELMKTAGLFGTMAVGLSGAGGAALLSISSFKKAQTAIANFSRAQRIATVGAGVAGAALVAAGFLYTAYAEKKAEATARTQDFVTALKAERDQQEIQVRDTINAAFAVEGFADAKEYLNLTTQELFDYVQGEANPALDDLIKSEIKEAAMVDESTRARGASWAALNALKTAIEQQRDALAGAIVITNRDTEAARANADANLDKLDGIVDFIPVAETQIELTKRLADEEKDAAAASKERADAYKEVRDAFVETFEDFDESSQGFNERLEDGKKEIQDWSDKINDSVDAAAEGFYEFEEDTDVSLQSFIDMLRDGNVDVQAWQEDLVAIAALTNTEFAAHIAAMGPEGAALAAELSEGGPLVDEALTLYTESARLAGIDIVAQFGNTADGVQAKMQELSANAELEASLLLVTLPPYARAAGEAFGVALKDGLAGTGPSMSAFATEYGAAAARAFAAAAGGTVPTSRGANRMPVGPLLPFTPSTWAGPDLTGVEDTVLHDGGPVTSTGKSGRKAGLRNDEVPAVLQTGEYVLSREDMKSVGGSQGRPQVTVQLTGDIYGVPDDEFVARLAVRLNRLAAGMA